MRPRDCRGLLVDRKRMNLKSRGEPTSVMDWTFLNYTLRKRVIIAFASTVAAGIILYPLSFNVHAVLLPKSIQCSLASWATNIDLYHLISRNDEQNIV